MQLIGQLMERLTQAVLTRQPATFDPSEAAILHGEIVRLRTVLAAAYPFLVRPGSGDRGSVIRAAASLLELEAVEPLPREHWGYPCGACELVFGTHRDLVTHEREHEHKHEAPAISPLNKPPPRSV